MHDAEGLKEAIDGSGIEDLVAMDLFDDQLSTETREQERHQAMQRQIERYVEDRILVLRRLRDTLDKRLERAQREWEAARGSDKRARAQIGLSKVTAELESVQEDLERMQSRDLDEYRKWQSYIDEPRFQLPTVMRIFDLHFVFDAGGA